MKIIDERETQTKKNKDRKEQGGQKAIVKGWELNDFVVCNYLQIIWALAQLFKVDYLTAKMLQTIYILI